MKIYGTNILIRPIIERDEIEEFYDRNDHKLISACDGIVEELGEGVTLDLQKGDRVYLKREFARNWKDDLIVIDQGALLLKY